MVTTVIVLGVLGWIACSVLTYGGEFAYFQREFSLIAGKNYDKDRRFALRMALFGPIGLLVVFVNTFFKHGLKFK